MNPSACGADIDAAIVELANATAIAGVLGGVYVLGWFLCASQASAVLFRAIRMRLRRNRRKASRA
jgi:hypothetical protein